MRIPATQFAIKTIADTILDDAFGMSPRAAYIVTSVAAAIVISCNFEKALANVRGNPACVKKGNLTDAEIDQLRKNGQFLGDENVFGPSLETKGAFEKAKIKGLMQDGKLVGSYQTRTLDVPLLKQLGAQHSSANALKVATGAKINPWTYATWGTCQQATNLTLLQAGISSTILDLGASWDMYVTTAVYGNYGGMLSNRIHAGFNANNNYEGKY